MHSGSRAQSAIALGFALAMSSTALVLPIAGTTSPVGRAALAMLLFEDLALVPLLFLFGTAAAGAASGLLDVLWKGTLVIGGLLVDRPTGSADALRPGGADEEP